MKSTLKKEGNESKKSVQFKKEKEEKVEVRPKSATRGKAPSKGKKKLNADLPDSPQKPPVPIPQYAQL